MEKKESRTEKGKGKERATEEPSDEQNGPSLAARIASSAAGLAGDFTRRPDGADAIATAFNSSGKLQGSWIPTSSATTWSEDVPDLRYAGNSSQLQGSGASERFRTTPSHSNGTAEFDQFSDARGNGLIGPQWDLNNFDLPLHASGEIFGRGALPASQDVSNHSIDDGAEVRMLLSDPTFSADSPEDFIDMDAEPTADDLFSNNFSVEEQGAANFMLNTLDPAPFHQSVPASHPLNLNPSLVQEEILELESSLTNDGASYMSFSNSHQREHLLSEWEDVLNSYTDSVWGDMLPIVQTARNQIQEVKAGTRQSLDTKAVSRLKMIVGHLRDTTRLPAPLTEHISPQRYLQKTGPPQEEQQENKKREVPTFHCPWISCHERFNNAVELRLHSSTHTFYTCPHLGCGQHFQETELEGWDEHVQVPHHDLLGCEGGARKEIETI